MIATIKSEKKKHYPVLLNEIISIITPQYGGTFIDCTFGQGGYSAEILKNSSNKIIALDRDLDCKDTALDFENKFKNKFIFRNKKFSELNHLKIKKEDIRGVIFDLGYSMSQIKDSKKGLSFNSKGKLNMRMGLNEFSANEVINKLEENELEKIFKFFGEEKDSKKIAYKIIRERKIKDINVEKLVQIIDSTKRKNNYKIHNATKIFQALRIFVNKEISELIYGLIYATKIVKQGGVIIVVSFHSIEDKIVKYFFKSLSESKSISRYMPQNEKKINLLKLVKKKTIIPSAKEITENPPSRSAKLRYVIKKENFYDFETDILEKFKYLIEIENYSQKL